MANVFFCAFVSDFQTLGRLRGAVLLLAGCCWAASRGIDGPKIRASILRAATGGTNKKLLSPGFAGEASGMGSGVLAGESATGKLNSKPYTVAAQDKHYVNGARCGTLSC